jgi:hypothetical protein
MSNNSLINSEVYSQTAELVQQADVFFICAGHVLSIPAGGLEALQEIDKAIQ